MHVASIVMYRQYLRQAKQPSMHGMFMTSWTLHILHSLDADSSHWKNSLSPFITLMVCCVWWCSTRVQKRRSGSRQEGSHPGSRSHRYASLGCLVCSGGCQSCPFDCPFALPFGIYTLHPVRCTKVTLWGLFAVWRHGKIAMAKLALCVGIFLSRFPSFSCAYANDYPGCRNSLKAVDDCLVYNGISAALRSALPTVSEQTCT